MIGPLIWLLLFDLLVCLVWWLVFSVGGVSGPPRLVQVMGIIVIAINVVVLIFWVMELFGMTAGQWMQGPVLRR